MHIILYIATYDWQCFSYYNVSVAMHNNYSIYTKLRFSIMAQRVHRHRYFGIVASKYSVEGFIVSACGYKWLLTFFSE